MTFNNVHQIFSTNLTNIHKCLDKILFSNRIESKKIPTKKKIQFGAKKVFFLGICECWSNWWKKFGVHCWTSCKITAQTDKNSGNESKIRLTGKKSSFYAHFFTPRIFYQKTREFWTPFFTFFGNFSTFSNYKVHDWTKETGPIEFGQKINSGEGVD